MNRMVSVEEDSEKQTVNKIENVDEESAENKDSNEQQLVKQIDMTTDANSNDVADVPIHTPVPQETK